MSPFRAGAAGTPVKQNEVKATYKDGMLQIELPKADEVRPKQIQVQVLGE